MGDKRNASKILVGKSEGNDLEYIGVDERIIIKLILMKGVKMRTGFIWIWSSCGPL
jgi:hypothetical protein